MLPICGGPASGDECRRRARECAAEGAGFGGGLAEHGAGGVGVDGVEEEWKVGVVRGAQARRVVGWGIVELVDVGGVAGRSVVAGDGERPVAEDELGLDLGQDVGRCPTASRAAVRSNRSAPPSTWPATIEGA